MSDDFEIFLTYDSDSEILDSSKCLEISLPAQNWYWISLRYIALQFPNGYTPDTFVGYIVISDTEETISGKSFIAGCGASKGRAIFPLDKPDNIRPTSYVYHKVRLHSTDKFKVRYCDKDMAPVNMTRLITTIHISNNPSIVRSLMK